MIKLYDEQHAFSAIWRLDSRRGNGNSYSALISDLTSGFPTSRVENHFDMRLVSNLVVSLV